MLYCRGSRAPTWKHQSNSLDVTCVDDDTILITGSDNDGLVINVRCVANLVDQSMSSHGMAVNWDTATTEVIMLWAGKRTRVCKRECNVTGVPGEWTCVQVCAATQAFRGLLFLRLPHRP